MLQLVGKRALVFGLSLFASSVLIFAAMSLLGGDAANAILGKEATPQALERLRDRLGLDQSLWKQYWDWVSGFVRGDLGVSPQSGLDVSAQISDRLAVTLPLAGLALLMTVSIGVPMGILSAARHRRPSGSIVSLGSQLGMSVPDFCLGLLLVVVFAVWLGWLPAGGFVPWSENPLLSLRSLILPALALALAQGAILTRWVRTAVLEVMREDFIRTARAKGMTSTQALWRHGLRNAAIPIVTVIGLQLSFLAGGVIVIENVFFLPGLGRLVVIGVEQRDVPLVQSATMTFAFLVLAISFLTELLYGVLDPRMRRRS
jgi:peptide/nickel transport system permease protein